MKVLVSTADSATVKEVSFSKFVDTSNKESSAPQISVVLPVNGNGRKKLLAVTQIAVHATTGHIATARKNGSIQLNEEVLASLSEGVECVGLFWGPENTDFADFLLAFGSDGQGLAIETAKNNKLLFSVRSDLTVVTKSPYEGLTFASAGAEVLPNSFTLEISENSVKVCEKWLAAAPPNNRLDLPERNLVTGLVFVAADILVSASSEGNTRVYDLLNSDPTAVDKPGQPVESTKVSQSGIKSIVADPTRPNTVLIGDSRTTVSRWSVNPSKLLGNYKGVSGSTRAISCRGKYVALGGLDRYLRVYDIEKRQPAGKVYLGEEIWALAFVKHDDEEDIDDVDTLWNDLGLANKRSRDNDTQVSKKAKLGRSTDNALVKAKSESKSEPESELESGSELESDGDSAEDSAEDSEEFEESDTSGEDSDGSFQGFD